MTKEVEPLDRMAQMHQIVSLYIKGATVPSIMSQTGLRRVDVLGYIDEYKEIIKNDPQTKERAQETLHNFDAHTSEILSEMWKLYEAASDDKVKSGLLKSLADVDKARVDTLQKAGLYDDAALGDELARTQEQAEQIKELLKRVVMQYPETKEMLLAGLNKIFNDESVGVEQPPLQGTVVTPPKEADS